MPERQRPEGFDIDAEVTARLDLALRTLHEQGRVEVPFLVWLFQTDDSHAEVCWALADNLERLLAPSERADYERARDRLIRIIGRLLNRFNEQTAAGVQ